MNSPEDDLNSQMTGFGPKLGCKDALEDHEMVKKKIE